MLVCNVSQSRRRAVVAAELAEAATALDSPGTGSVVFATLVDDPASVGDLVDAYLGEIMLEAVSADAVVDGYIPATYVAGIVEPATATDTQDGSAATAAPTAWNPADKAGSVTFSNSNLTLTGAGNGAVRGVGSLSSGKYYWEYTYVFVNTNNLTPGVALASANLGSLGAGVALVQRASGQITINASNVGTPLGAIPAGGVLGVAVDFTNQLIWFRIAPSGNWNGSGTANPATGTGGLSISAISGALYPMGAFGNGDILTANFGASAFTGSVPSGFTAGFLT